MQKGKGKAGSHQFSRAKCKNEQRSHKDYKNDVAISEKNYLQEVHLNQII
jgi:hypothetical protein